MARDLGLRLTELLEPGDACDFRPPVGGPWRPGIVERNGGSYYWVIYDPARDQILRGCQIEHVRAVGTDPWNS